MSPSDEHEIAAGALLAKQLGDGRVFYLEASYLADGPFWTWFRRAAARSGTEIAGRAT